MNTKVTIHAVRLAMCAGLLLTLSACDRAARMQEYQDELAVMRDKSHVQLVSREMSEALATAQYPQALQQFQKKGLDIDADARQYELAATITKRLAMQAMQMYPHARNWQWDLHVIGVDEMNAWCMAGGKMVIYSGLMNLVNDQPDKIAAVMGHEIAHALLEHTRQGLTREFMLNSSLWIAAKSLKVGAVRTNAIKEDLALALRGFDREYERQADALGLELMARAGFDPEMGSEIWVDMQKPASSAGEKRLNAFNSDHPLSEERLVTLRRMAKELKKGGAARAGGQQ